MDRARRCFKSATVHNLRQGILLSALAVTASGQTYTSDDYGPKCSDSNVNVAIQIRDAVNHCSALAIYRTAAITGNQVKPELKKLLNTDVRDMPCNGYMGEWGAIISSREVITFALAKLGDEDALQEFKNRLNQPANDFRKRDEVIKTLGKVGNDQALAILMDFFAAHYNDGTLVQHHGDYYNDERHQFLAALGSISSRREMPGLPVSGNTMTEISQELAAWWEQWRNKLPSPPYVGVSDPYLQCLARKVDWGFRDAILDIGEYDGKDAEKLLHKFPDGGDLSSNRNIALAKLRNRSAFLKLVSNLRSGSGQRLSTGAPELFRYIGGRDAVDALVNSLDIRPEADKDYPIKGYSFSEADYDKYHQAMMKALSAMVKNPPLPATTPPTHENIRKWQEWWIKNKDTAEFVVEPPKHRE